ncbi:MAG: hypothetical protein R3D29_03255 [Nitratireductor sp.]
MKTWQQLPARLARVAGISATQAASQYALALREGKISDEDLTSCGFAIQAEAGRYQRAEGSD